MSRVGLFGGAFNPPHNGHVAAARRAVSALHLSRLIVMPTGVSPHKEPPPGSPSPYARLAMTQLAMRGVPGAEVSDWEIKNPGPNYTVETLRHLMSPRTELFLVVGADMFLTLHEWVDPASIFETAQIAVLARDADQESAVAAQARLLDNDWGARVTLIPHTPFVVSSTLLRERMRYGEGRDALPPPVFDFIRENRLYGC